MTKRRASTFIPSEWSFYCPNCKNNKHLEWNRKKEMIQCDACSSLFPGPSCKYCPSEFTRPHQLKYGRWRCRDCSRTFIAKEDHVREKIEAIEAKVGRGELSLEKVSEEDKNNDSDDDSSESSSTTEHSHFLEIPHTHHDASSDSEDSSHYPSSYPRSPRRKRGFDMVTETTPSQVHDHRRATTTFGDIQTSNSPSHILAIPTHRKKSKRDEALEQDKVVLRILCPQRNQANVPQQNVPSVVLSSPASLPIAISDPRRQLGSPMIKQPFSQPFQQLSPLSPGTICPLWMHLGLSPSQQDDPMNLEPSGTSYFEDGFGIFPEDLAHTPPEPWYFNNTEESGWEFAR